MDFFESQDAARRNTGRLVILFVLAVIAIMIAIYLLVALLFGVGGGYAEIEGSRRAALLLDWRLMAAVGAITLAVVGLGSLYKMAQLRAGGGFVAESLGGALIHPETTDPVERRVLNVVEEMAIASGTPCPPVYMLGDEKGINAFAAGFSPEDACIGVTRGCAEQLSRDQLQGVIAHEFSHILNGDMRLNIRLIGILNGILVVGIIGYFILRSSFYAGGASRRSGKRDGAGAILLLGAGLAVIGFVGTFFGNWIKAAVSRQREFLADASAVQFTRNPSGIAGALKRIGGYAPGAKVESPNAPEASHMFFGRAITSGLNSIFATHPPLPVRIERLEPSWDGEFITTGPAPEPEAAKAPGAPRAHEARAAAIAGLVGAAAAERPAPPRVSAVKQIGRPTQEHIDHAARLIQRIPAQVANAARESYGARAVVYGLLINREPAPRRVQTDRLDEHADRGVCRLTAELLPALENLSRELRLPLVDLALPALRNLSPPQYAVFKQNVQALVDADGKIDLFEWALQRIILRHLEPQFSRVKPPVTHYYALRRLGRQCSALLSTLAYVGHRDRAAAQRAFSLAISRLAVRSASMLPPEACTMQALDEALHDLNRTTPRLKKQILTACAACVSADREVTVDEAELFRALCDGLSCPMPPLLPGQPLG
ncbi:MAG: M48 family metallopeptidase [Planctomycetota bacterium]|nr:M48 family metallopeptidase [Planctomycetota bacterium]